MCWVDSENDWRRQSFISKLFVHKLTQRCSALNWWFTRGPRIIFHKSGTLWSAGFGRTSFTVSFVDVFVSSLIRCYKAVQEFNFGVQLERLYCDSPAKNCRRNNKSPTWPLHGDNSNPHLTFNAAAVWFHLLHLSRWPLPASWWHHHKQRPHRCPNGRTGTRALLKTSVFTFPSILIAPRAAIQLELGWFKCLVLRLARARPLPSARLRSPRLGFGFGQNERRSNSNR